MSAAERLSATAAGLAVALRPLVGLVRPDLGDELDRRRAAAGRLRDWGDTTDGRPVVWLHGASAGELLGAAPAIRALADLRPHALLVTHFSPSGRLALPRLDPARASPPPLDTPADCDVVMAALRPVLLVFAKLDVWPGLVASAGRHGVPTALVNAVVRDGSRRDRPIARRLFRPVYGALDRVGAATETDAERLRRLGVRPSALEVTGDAAFDLALARADAAAGPLGARARLDSALPDRPPRGARLVAGSTWPPDEEALLAALDGGEGLRWQPVIAPHDPTEARVRGLLGACRARRRPAVRWSELAAGDRAPAEVPAHAVVVFDEVGGLAELYTAGDAAWVGGGLDGRGLHNVLEPAAAGVPVLFGPRHGRRDAEALVSGGGGEACGARELADRLSAWLDPAVREPIGARARTVVESGAGAGVAAARLLASAWERRPPSPRQAKAPSRRSGT